MNGPGTAPPQPRPTGDGGAVALRVLFMVIGYVGFSLLNWILLLRLALLRRRPMDWVVFGAVGIVLPGICLSMISDSDNITGPADATGTFGFVGLWLFTPVYFLVLDIQYRKETREAAAAQSYAAPSPYPYAQPHPQPQLPGRPGPYEYNPYSHTPTPPPPPAPAPPPAVPQPPRINQVRAELDELSDLLRKQEGDQ
ncbi:hypothetical protein ACFXJ5_29995 [Streptomyces sp. NPDC059373]